MSEATLMWAGSAFIASDKIASSLSKMLTESYIQDFFFFGCMVVHTCQ